MHGDFRGLEQVPSNYAIVQKSGATTAQTNARSRFMCRIGAPTVYAHAILADNIPVYPGDRFSVRFDYAMSGTVRQGRIDVRLIFQDTDGEDMTPVDTSVIDVANLTWLINREVLAAPTGAVSLKIALHRSSTEAFGFAYVTNLEVTRQRSGATYITPFSITSAQLIATESIITASAQIGDLTVRTLHVVDGDINRRASGVRTSNLTLNSESTWFTIASATETRRPTRSWRS